MTGSAASGPLRRLLTYAALAVLFGLHNDLWLWHDGRLVFGLPAGLAYHLGYCAAAALLMAALVRWAWPIDPEPATEQPIPLPPRAGGGPQDPGPRTRDRAGGGPQASSPKPQARAGGRP